MLSIFIAVSMSVILIWREITQLTASTDDAPISSTVLMLILTLIVFIVSGMMYLNISRDTHHRQANILLGIAIIALIALCLQGVWHLSAWQISIWSVPSVAGMVLFICLCLVALQLENVGSGTRQWGFLMSGFDRRDVINISVLGLLFFGVSHLIATYDPLAVAGSQLPLALLPIFAIASAVSLSTLSAHVVRIPMATFIAGFFLLSIRNIIFASLSLEAVASTVIPVVLGPVFVLDVWQWMKSGQASTHSTAITATLALFLNYPIFDQWLGISFSGQDYLLIMAAAFMVALGADRLAKQMAQHIHTLADVPLQSD